MKRYVEGEDRTQSVLFPERLDDYIGENNPVRVIEAFVNELDLKALGFNGMEPENTGRPSYHPGLLLKIYIYGYLNRVQSSRRLERETQRNVELMWLTGRLSPDFKTIADFRKDNGVGIRRTCSQFIALCRQLKLFTESLVAIDGSKFKAVNSSSKAFSAGKLAGYMQQLEERVGRYMEELDRADREPTQVSDIHINHVEQKIASLRNQLRHLKEIGEQIEQSPDHQVALTDPDARCMSSLGRDTLVVGYNVQAAVDAKNHLIVAHEVTNIGNDRAQLASMSQQAQKAIDSTNLTVLADRGYYNGIEILKCEQQGITALVPKSLTSNNRAQGLFDKADFRYFPKENEFQCPAGQRAIWRFSTQERGHTIHKYWSSACPKCPMKSQCTTGKHRRITRWEHESVLEAAQQRLDRMPEAYRIRRKTIEHVFGTLKMWMGSTHFLMKTMPKVGTEMSLHVLAYNMQRVIKIMGVQPGEFNFEVQLG